MMMSNEETVVLPSGRKERRRRWKFAETPVMSTYLLALVRLLVPVLVLLFASVCNRQLCSLLPCKVQLRTPGEMKRIGIGDPSSCGLVHAQCNIVSREKRCGVTQAPIALVSC